MATNEFQSQVLTFEVCTCSKCRDSSHPVGRLLTAEGEVYSTFFSKERGVWEIKTLPLLGIITGENASELIGAIEASGMFRYEIDPYLVSKYRDYLPELCDREAELVGTRTAR